ncbi:Hypothetical predicted protein [Lecanosticta acicola]|uniref:NAD(P)-binding domain-containing protein n=1 Tax=Lecanosticta acicola TaxID=111012 RepID=A0AAI8W0X0_9PEZI|nr:Hypothetical predicted protein [Lecanosticta acicola]
MASPNYLKNVAIVGAGGNSGSFMTAELLKTGKHIVTALTRADSKAKLPEGVTAKTIDYEKAETIVKALQGQDVLVITMSVVAPKDQQAKLVNAAIAAGVEWVIPNHWAPDTTDEGLARDVVNFGGLSEFQKWIEDQGKIKHISLSTGFWYEWSLAIPPSYGFDLAKRKVTYFDQGQTKISTSTWPQVGRAVAALLSLPIKAEGSDKGLEDFQNKLVYISSFTVSQQEMFESILRVTGSKEEDWTVSEEPAVERYEEAVKAMKAKGPERYAAFVRMMYTRVFYPDGNGDLEARRGTLNSLLGLPEEDMDEATRRAIERAESGNSGYGGQ